MSKTLNQSGLQSEGEIRIPEGFRELHLKEGWGWVRPEVEGWFRNSLSESGSLYGAARKAVADSGTPGPELQGRAPVFVVPLDGATVAVRHYLRGGSVASLLGDRYLRLGTPRPIIETLASEKLHALGIPTSRVLAAAVYPRGPWYRGDLVTEFIPGAVDLGSFLFGEGSDRCEEQTRIGALREAISLMDRLADAGLVHPDLNVKNFLVEVEGDTSGIRLLDLDRCGPRGGADDLLRKIMIARFRRSLSRWEERTGKRLSQAEWGAADYIPIS